MCVTMDKLPTKILKFIGFIIFTHYTVTLEIINWIKGEDSPTPIDIILCDCGNILKIENGILNYSIKCKVCDATVVHAPSKEACTYAWIKCNENSWIK